MKKELQRILRREFDNASIRPLAKEVIEIAKATTVNGEPLGEDFIKEMENDLND